MLSLDFNPINIYQVHSKLYLYVILLTSNLLFYFKGIFFTLSLIYWLRISFLIIFEIFVEKLNSFILLFNFYGLTEFDHKIFIKLINSFNCYLGLLSNFSYFYSNTFYTVKIKELFIFLWLLLIK